MKTDKELADELDAKDRLRARGYKQEMCDMCNGPGVAGPDIYCPRCEGKGYRWSPPIEK